MNLKQFANSREILVTSNILRNRNISFLAKKFYDFIFEPVVSSDPLFIQLEPTTFCNLSCPMCIQRNGKNMSFKNFKRIAGMFKSLQHIHFQGIGEPLMNPEIFNFIRYSTKNGIGSSITSNGILLKKETLKKLKKNGLTHLYLSIDAPTKKTYEKIRRGAKFETLIKNLEDNRGNIDRIMTIVMKENINEIEGMVDFCKKYDVPMLYLHYENYTPNVSKKIREVVLKTKKKAAEHGIGFKSLVPLNPKRRMCKWFWLGSYITVEGNVFPCCNWVWFSKKGIENIFKKDFRNIWNSNEYRKLRIAMKTDAHEICKKCHRLKVSFI